MDNPRLPYLSDKAHGLPLLPGVYIMKNKAGDIIYIGKAKALKNRVSSYFRSVEKHLPKVYRMVSQVFDFDYIVTDSEFEALVLECSMIKLHTPKYNILLKDDKGYSYIKIFPKEYSRIRQTFQREEDGAEYIGPYLSAYVVKETIDEANRVFLLPTCSKRFPQEFGKGRPCLNFHIKRCMGVCQGRISLEEYHEILAQALEYIKGGSSQSVELMTRQMNEYAENMQFEKAAQLRDAPARSLKAAVKLQSPPTAVHLPSFPRFRRRCTGFRSSIPGRNTRRAHSPSHSPNAKGSATSAPRKSTNSSKRSRRSGRLRSMSWRRSRGCPTRQRSGCTSFCMRKIDKSA